MAKRRYTFRKGRILPTESGSIQHGIEKSLKKKKRY